MCLGSGQVTVDKQGFLACISVSKELCNEGSAKLFCFWHVSHGCKPVKCYNVLFWVGARCYGKGVGQTWDDSCVLQIFKCLPW